MAIDTTIDTTARPLIETVLRLRNGAATDLGALPEGIAAALRGMYAQDIGEL